jgi:predicted RNA-binding protein YlqC (UPF0109 family)
MHLLIQLIAAEDHVSVAIEEYDKQVWGRKSVLPGDYGKL